MKKWRIGGAGRKPIFAIKDGETSLADLANVICNYCHKTRHLRKDCADLVSKFPGCGKTGHHTDECWRDPKNANGCPQWMKETWQKMLPRQGELKSLCHTSQKTTSLWIGPICPSLRFVRIPFWMLMYLVHQLSSFLCMGCTLSYWS